MLTVAVTCTVPASCLGDTAVHWVEELQLTDFESVAPNFLYRLAIHLQPVAHQESGAFYSLPLSLPSLNFFSTSDYPELQAPAEVTSGAR